MKNVHAQTLSEIPFFLCDSEGLVYFSTKSMSESNPRTAIGQDIKVLLNEQDIEYYTKMPFARFGTEIKLITLTNRNRPQLYIINKQTICSINMMAFYLVPFGIKEFVEFCQINNHNINYSPSISKFLARNEENIYIASDELLVSKSNIKSTQMEKIKEFYNSIEGIYDLSLYIANRRIPFQPTKADDVFKRIMMEVVNYDFSKKMMIDLSYDLTDSEFLQQRVDVHNVKFDLLNILIFMLLSKLTNNNKVFVKLSKDNESCLITYSTSTEDSYFIKNGDLINFTLIKPEINYIIETCRFIAGVTNSTISGYYFQEQYNNSAELQIHLLIKKNRVGVLSFGNKNLQESFNNNNYQITNNIKKIKLF